MSAMGAADPLSRHYSTLTPAERFSLMVEAMARRDDAEADRLEDSCPRFTYRMEDDQFRGRMRRAYAIALMATLNMRAGLAQLRLAKAFREMSGHFAAGPQRLAEAAFLFGRSYGHWEAGAVDDIDLPDGQELAAQFRDNPDLGRQLAGLRGVAAEGVQQVADLLHAGVCEAHGADLLAQWEGFCRFCREELGVEAPKLLRAFGLGAGEDPAAEVLAGRPSARTGDAAAAAWAAQWTRLLRRQ